MLIIMSGVMTLVFLATTISIYSGLKKSPLTNWIVKLVQKSFIVSFALNFVISLFIGIFTGTGAAAGLANLLASLIFAIYVIIDKKRNSSASGASPA